MKCLIQKHSVAVSWRETPPILPTVLQSVPSDTTGMEGSILLLSCAVQSFFSTEEDKLVQSVIKSKNQGIPGLCKKKHNLGDFCEKPKQRNEGKKALVDWCIEGFAEMIP